MEKEFTENGFYLRYPADWTLEEPPESNGETINLMAPGDGGFFSLSRYPSSTSPEELTEAVLRTILEEYAGAEVSPARNSYGTRVLTGYDVDFFLLDFSCAITIRAMQHSAHTYIIFTQHADTLEKTLTENFAQITVAWIEGLGKF